MSNNLKSQLESILLVSSKPISVSKLSEILSVKPKDVEAEINSLSQDYNERGIRLLRNNNQVQFVSAPENTDIIQNYLKDDLTGELTKPSLETLTIIAYRQPISKAEIEQIRGVNCSLILRNLLIRGLVEAEYNKEKALTLYNATMDFLKYLGLNSVAELPDFEKLNSDENLQKLLAQENYQQEASEDKVFKIDVRKS